MRVVGLDVGSKTIGVAVSDELGLAAHPRTTLARRGTRRDVDAVAALIHAEAAERVVVGIPYSLDGRMGLRARRVMVLVTALRARLGERVPVETWDERFSTVEAERVLLQADVSRRRRRQVIDKLAAAVILQGWLDDRAARG